MPYIKDAKQRKIFNELVDKLAIEIQIAGGPRGNLNYCVFKLFITYRKNSNRLSGYSGIADFLSELRECECELRRRFLQPHEDKKIKENGDVK